MSSRDLRRRDVGSEVDEIDARVGLRRAAHALEQLRVHPAARLHGRVLRLRQPRLFRIAHARAQDELALAEQLARHALHVRLRQRPQLREIAQVALPAALGDERVPHRERALFVVLPALRLLDDEPGLERLELPIVEPPVAHPLELIDDEPFGPMKRLREDARHVGDDVEVVIREIGRHVHGVEQLAVVRQSIDEARALLVRQQPARDLQRREVRMGLGHRAKRDRTSAHRGHARAQPLVRRERGEWTRDGLRIGALLPRAEVALDEWQHLVGSEVAGQHERHVARHVPALDSTPSSRATTAA